LFFQLYSLIDALGFRDDSFEPLVVETCWPTKKRRLGDFRRKRSFQAESVEVPQDVNLDVVLQGDAVEVSAEANLDDVLQGDAVEMPPDANLDVVLQGESAEVQTVETVKTVNTVQTDETESAEVQTDAVLALGSDVRRPSRSDANKTKSMAVLLGVKPKSNGKKIKKVTAKKKK
jgi:hypothetical protein